MTGHFATSTAGNDRGACYVIVDEDADFVHLCDGRRRTFTNPKRKRKKHIRLDGCKVGQELLHRLKTREKVWDEEIKYAIKQYIRSC